MGSLYICVKTPARSYLHEGTLACMQPWVVDPVSLSCRKVTYPTAQGRASLARLLLLLRFQARACFVWESSVGDPTLRTEATGICVVPWEEAPGDPRAGLLGPSEAFGLSPSLLIPGRAPFARCAARSASTIWLSHLGPSCWYLTRPALLLVHSPKQRLYQPSSVRLID